MKNNRLVIFGTIAIVFLFGVFVFLLWILGLFDYSGTEASTKILTSIIALLGGVFASMITLVGLLFKHSIDLRTTDLKEKEEARLQFEVERNVELKEREELRLKLEADRINNQREEAERRSKVEAAIRAVQLLSSSSGADVPAVQKAGVLFTLVHLELPELALSIMGKLLDEMNIDPRTAAWVIDQVFQSKDKMLKRTASAILLHHADRFLVDGGRWIFPSSVVLDWNLELPLLGRRATALAMFALLLSRRASLWRNDSLNTLLATLCIAWEKESNQEIQHGVGICLVELLPTRAGFTLALPDKRLDVDEMIKNVASAQESLTSTTFVEFRQQFKTWVTDPGLENCPQKK